MLINGEEELKEKEELKEVLGNLASLVDGDVDKAAQLYISGGENIEGGKSLYQELRRMQTLVLILRLLLPLLSLAQSPDN